MSRQPASGNAKDSIVPSKNKQYIQTNRTNVFPLANLWSTFNIDLQSNLGTLRIFPRLKLNVTGPTLTNLGLPVAFQYFDNYMWAIAGTRMFRAAAPFLTNAFVEDTDGFARTDFSAASDLAYSNAYMIGTTKDELLKKGEDGTGTQSWISIHALSDGVSHKLAYFKKFDRTYVLDNYCFVFSLDNAQNYVHAGDYTLAMTGWDGPSYSLTSIKASSNFLWIGAVSLVNSDRANKGILIQWDGLSAQPTNIFPVNAHGIVSVIVGEDDIPYVMDSNGILQKYSGYGLVEVGRLPNNGINLLNAGQATTGQFMDANGMCFTKNKTILANVCGMAENGDYIENFPGGVYEFDLKGNCTHLGSPSMNPINSSTIIDFAQNRVEIAGAIINTENLNIQSAQQSKLLIGANYRNASLNGVNGIFVDDFTESIQKKGYWVSTWFESGEIASSWNGWWATFKKLGATDNIVFKYRLTEESPKYVSDLTWVDNTHFTVPNSSCVVSNYWTEGTGGEVEILAGVGAGTCVHIINAVLVAGTWTVTIDEALVTSVGIPGVVSYARFQKWIKMFPKEDLTSGSLWGNWALNTDSTPRIQLKACFTYTGVGEYHKGVLISSEDISSN
jgi:hypothetical protein